MTLYGTGNNRLVFWMFFLDTDLMILCCTCYFFPNNILNLEKKKTLLCKNSYISSLQIPPCYFTFFFRYHHFSVSG